MCPSHMKNMIGAAITPRGANRRRRAATEDLAARFSARVLYPMPSPADISVHIVAKLLGHENLATTKGYTAVFQEDVMANDYRKFVEALRSLRPTDEYRSPTDEEIDEFHQHFT